MELPDGWIEMEPTERSKLFRTHIFTNDKMMEYCDLARVEIAKLDKETRWDLFLVFYPDSKRDYDFFLMIKNFDIHLQSWIYYDKLFAYLDDKGYQKRGDIHYGFVNIGIILKDFLLEKKKYYLAHPEASVLEARHLHQEKGNYLAKLPEGVFEKELLPKLE